MLAYAFQSLQVRGWRDVATEDFDNVADLCCAILCKGMSAQLRRGLWREYVPFDNELSTVRGKIDVTASIKGRSLARRQLVCEYDEFSVDSWLNRIVKSTLKVLLGSADLAMERRHEARRVLSYLGEVGDVSLRRVDWNVRYDRNNQEYRMLLGICRLVCEGLLQSQGDGGVRVLDVFDEQRMSRLYERFVLEYFRREHPNLGAAASQIPWALDDGAGDMLPTMKSDISLTSGTQTLIIDTKYYGHATQSHFGVRTVHSANLYQIFTYVKNRQESFGTGHDVAGMLLYAQTDEDMQPGGSYLMSGNRIEVRSLNLGGEFSEIAAQLDGIVEEHFGLAREVTARPKIASGGIRRRLSETGVAHRM